MPPTIDVVIPVLDRYELTRKCLERLDAQTLSHRVIVVDDGSTDGTPARVRADWPGVHVVELGRNHGFPAAVNRGVRAGTGEVIVLLNNDVECKPGFLERLVAPLADPKVGSVAALMLEPSEQRIDGIGLVVDVTLAAFSRLHAEPAASAGARDPVLAGPSGGAGAYRRSAWEEVGGMDESLFSYMEDVDLALRLAAASWRTAAAPDAIAIHLGSASWGHRSARQRRQGGFARGYMLRRYGVLRGKHALRALATEAVVVLGDLAISRDAQALEGRVAGWRTGGSVPRVERPPDAAIDRRIGFRAALGLRRMAYGDSMRR